jgi:hypothetical protein
MLDFAVRAATVVESRGVPDGGHEPRGWTRMLRKGAGAARIRWAAPSGPSLLAVRGRSSDIEGQSTAQLSRLARVQPGTAINGQVFRQVERDRGPRQLGSVLVEPLALVTPPGWSTAPSSAARGRPVDSPRSSAPRYRVPRTHLFRVNLRFCSASISASRPSTRSRQGLDSPGRRGDVRELRWRHPAHKWYRLGME